MAKNYQVGSPSGLCFEHVDSKYIKDTVCIQHNERLYKNLYMIIRALNHEELHSIIQKLEGEFASASFDCIIDVPSHNDNTYELRDRTWETERVK